MQVSNGTIRPLLFCLLASSGIACHGENPAPIRGGEGAAVFEATEGALPTIGSGGAADTPIGSDATGTPERAVPEVGAIATSEPDSESPPVSLDSSGDNPAAPMPSGDGQEGATEPPATDRGLHVEGRDFVDGNGERVILRGPELVYRWGTYAGLTPRGVDVAWEGDRNGAVGAAEIREIASTGANAVRLLGGSASEIDAYLTAAIVEEKMFVAIARVNWEDPEIMAVLKKHERYLLLHPRGEFTHRDANLWRTEALTVISYIRSLGYTSAIEIGTTGYGQTWPTIAMYGEEVAASDPLKNTAFLLQLYSEHASMVSAIADQAAAFPYPVIVDACIFQIGIDLGYGNTATSYQDVWNESWARELSSFYWDWIGDGENNSMTTNGTLAGLNGIGQYIVYDGPAALRNTTKTSYLLNASVD